MRGVGPSHQAQTFRAPEQAVDRRVGQLPAARRLQIQPGRQAVQHVEHAAVRHHQHLLARVARGQLVDRGHHARLQLQQRLAARRREVGQALAPSLGFGWISGLQLNPGEAFERAKPAFSQTRVHFHFVSVAIGHRLRGLAGARQIAGVTSGDRFVAQRLRELAGLPAAEGVERDVGMALDAGVAVPRGFAVAHGQYSGDLQNSSWWGHKAQRGQCYGNAWVAGLQGCCSRLWPALQAAGRQPKGAI